MTLLYNMYKPFWFILRIALHVKWSNFWNAEWNFAKFFRVVAIWLDNNGYKISWQSLENWLTGYRKANFHFGPSSTVGQIIDDFIIESQLP